MPSLSSFMKSPSRAERKKASPPPSSPGGHDMFSPGPSSTRKRRPSQDDALPPVDDATDDADPLRRDVRVGPGRIGRNGLDAIPGNFNPKPNPKPNPNPKP